MKTRTFTYDGFTGTAKEWAARLKISPNAFWRRMREWGGDANARVFKSGDSRGHDARLYEYDGSTGTAKEWAARLKISPGSFRRRMREWGGDANARVFKSGDSRGRVARLYELDGERKTLHEWAAECGLTYHALYNRLKIGYPLAEAVKATPKFGHGGWQRNYGGRREVIGGIEDNIKGHCRRFGMSVRTVRERLRMGWGLVAALTTPVYAKSNEVGSPMPPFNRDEEFAKALDEIRNIGRRIVYLADKITCERMPTSFRGGIASIGLTLWQ